MTKRIFALLLTAALVMSMIVLPAGAINTDTIESTTSTTQACPCGCGKTLAQVEWKPWNVNQTGDPTQGHYFLEDNYVQNSEVVIISGLKVVLDLRGYTLTTASANRIATVNGYFAVMDTVGGGRLSALTGTGSGGVIVLKVNETVNPTFELYSGTITPDPKSSKLPANGGVVFVYEGCTFNMYGGALLGGKTSEQGGNLSSQKNSTVRITGGSLIGGNAGKNGGNIYCFGQLIMENCQIIGGTAAGWGGNLYLTNADGNLVATNVTISHGVSNCSEAINANKNGGGNVACMSNSTSSFINCSITGGYCAKNGGNLYLGSGNHTVTGGTVSGGTANNANNIYCTGNVTLDGCNIAGDVEQNGATKLVLKGALKIGLLNTGLTLAKTDVQATVSGLTNGAEIYLNADGVTLENANAAYFKPAIRTKLTASGTSITAAKAADGETAGYCPHCNAQVAWTLFDATKATTEGGHFYYSASASQSSQLTLGKNITTDVDTVVDLNGYTISAAGRYAYIYDDSEGENGHSLTIMDSAGSGKLTGKGISKTYFQPGGVLYNEENVTIYGGTIALIYDSSRGLSNGGVVYNGSVFNIYGGILDGSAYDQQTKNNLDDVAKDCLGGVIYMGTGNTRFLNMSGGALLGGSAKYGGAIYVNYNNNVDITGGTILGGSASTYGGNICMHYQSASDTSRRSADVNISNCRISGGTASSYGGNIFANWGTFDLDNSFVADGTATSHGGNLFSNTAVTTTVEDSILLGGSAKTGGNIHSAATNVNLNLNDSLVLSGKATGNGGNLSAGNGNNTISGGAILFGCAYNSASDATAYAGNIYANAGTVNATSTNHTTINDNTLIAGGYSETTGGNIHVNGVLKLNSATIRGGKAGTKGQDIYLNTFTTQQKLSVGSGLSGDISFYAEETTHPIVYGQAIAKTEVTGSLNAQIVLENPGYGSPMLIAENNALCVAALAVMKADGSAQWFTDATAAMAAYTPGSKLLLATDTELTLTQDCIIDVCGSTVTVHGNYKVTGMDSANDDYTTTTGKLIFADLEEANVTATAPVSTGSMYLPLIQGNTATFHRLDFGIEAVSIRTSNCGIYYNGTWSCDEVLSQEIDKYGIVLSTKGMPTADFIAQEEANGNMWTEPEEKLGVGTTNNSVLISNIMKTTDVDAETNNARGKKPIYATAYVTIDGTTYISDDTATEEDNVDYSLYSAMELMDRLITNYPEQFRRYSNAMRDFYDKWDTFGMESWDFAQVFIPEEDDVIDVLMIGSSFCYYYVEELAQLAAAAGINMRVCNAYHSGAWLYQHYNWWNSGAKEYQFFETIVRADGTVSRVQTTPVSMEWCLMQQQWDVISLQEHPTNVWKTDVQTQLEATRNYYTTLYTYLREQFPETQLLFQQTWAYQPGYDFSGYKLDTTEQQTIDAADIKEYAENVCRELQALNVGIVPSGSAWQNVRTGQFGEAFDNLCARISKNNGLGDYYHEGDLGGGQYLNACVWFEVITGKDCRQYDSFIPYYEKDSKTPVSSEALSKVMVVESSNGYTLEKDFVDLLQECAHAAVQAAYAEAE